MWKIIAALLAVGSSALAQTGPVITQPPPQSLYGRAGTWTGPQTFTGGILDNGSGIAAQSVLMGTNAGAASNSTLVPTAASGNGTTVTLTFAGGNTFPVGSGIIVAGMTPSAYNANNVAITASTSTSISYASAATGAMTVAGTVKPTSQGQITAIGDGAGASWVAGGLTAVGYNACNSAIAGTNGALVCIGAFSGRSDNGSTGNIYIGDQAGLNNTTGRGSIIIGRQAGINLTTGDGQTIIGINAGQAITTGVNNTCVGVNACQFSGPTSHDNTFSGASSGRGGGATGSYNYVTALGAASYGCQNPTGDIGSVVIGVYAGFGNGNCTTSTGGLAQSVVIGPFAATAAETTQRVVLIGYQVGNWGTQLKTGSDGVLISTNSNINGVVGAQVATSATNTFFCQGAGMKCGSNDFLLGLGVGSATAQDNNHSVMFGKNTGTLVTTGTYNLIGGQDVATTTLATGNHNILIGTDNTVDTPASTTSYWLNIGNGVKGTLTKPTIGSGFGTSPSVPSGASSFAFTINVGTGGTATSGVVSFPVAAPTGWACDVTDSTSVATIVTASVPTSTTSVTLTSYSRTTGVAAAWAASDILVSKCVAY